MISYAHTQVSPELLDLIQNVFFFYKMVLDMLDVCEMTDVS